MTARAAVTAPYPVVSASQINTFATGPDAGPDTGGCARKYAFKYLLKLEERQGEAAALGTDIDDGQLQPYLVEGRDLDFTRRSGYIAATAQAYLPAPKTPGVECQFHFVIPSELSPTPGTPEGPQALWGYQGYMDVWSPTSAVLPKHPAGLCIQHTDCKLDDALARECMLRSRTGLVVPLVLDFKSTSNLRYAKTPSSLKQDVQAMLYAKAAVVETGADEVDLYWLYMRTKDSPKCEPRYVRVTRAEIDAVFARIERVAAEMHAVRSAAPPYTKTLADHVEKDDPIRQTPEWNSTAAREQRNHARIANNPATLAYAESLEPNTSACDSFGGCPFRAQCNLSPDQLIDGLVSTGGTYRPRARNLSPDQRSLLDELNEPEATKDPNQMSALDALRAKKAARTEAAPAPAPTGAAPPPPAADPINPPEKSLPPADPIGVVAALPEAPAEAPKATGKGRPKGSKNKPKEEAPADTEMAKAADALIAAAPEGTLAEPDTKTIWLPTPSKPKDEVHTGSVTWSEERYTKFGRGYGVGPVTLNFTTREGESVQEAMKRTHLEIGAFISKARELHAEKFKENDARLTPAEVW